MTSLGDVRLRDEERREAPETQPQLIELKANQLINRQPNANFDGPPNFRYWGKADMARTCQYVR